MNINELKQVRGILRSDDRFVRIETAFKKLPQYNIPLDAYRRELRSLHVGRKFSKLKANDPNFLRHLSEALINDQSYRSRIVEMLTEVGESYRQFSRTLTVLRDYLIVHYNNHLKSVGTKGERQQFVESVMRKFYEYVGDLDSFQQEAKLVTDDIDKASFAMKHLIDAYAIYHRPEIIGRHR